MLQFIEMCIKIFGLCSIMGIIILIPISMTSDDSNLENEKSLDRLSITVIQNGSNRLIAYLVLMYTFTLIVFYFLKQSYNTYIYLRAQYLLRLSKTMASRSVIITGIPEELRNDQSLAEYYERLEIGSVESCYVVRTIHGLHKLIKRRADALLKLERAYATFWRNPCTIPGYDPDRILDDVKMYRRVLEAADKRAEEAGTSSSSEEEEDLREKFRKNNKKKKTFLNTTFFKGLVEPNAMMGAKESHRPQVRTGLWGLFGQKVDAIEYYTKLFDDLDKTVVERRTSPLYEMTSVAFITFEHMSSAVRYIYFREIYDTDHTSQLDHCLSNRHQSSTFCLSHNHGQ
jgi:hypothetical protein